MNFVRFESKRVKLEFDGLSRELEARPDPVKDAWRRRQSVPIDLSAPLAPSPRLAALNRERQTEMDGVHDGDAA
jgi:hypothetical protein